MTSRDDILADCTIAIMRAVVDSDPRPDTPQVRFKWSRETWIGIGNSLIRAREVCGGKAAFGQWIHAVGIDRIPGLKSPVSRSDAMWMARNQGRVALVNRRKNHPRHVRLAWRQLFAIAITDCVDQLQRDGELEFHAQIEAEAEWLVAVTGAGLAESLAAIEAEIAIRRKDARRRALRASRVPAAS